MTNSNMPNVMMELWMTDFSGNRIGFFSNDDILDVDGAVIVNGWGVLTVRVAVRDSIIEKIKIDYRLELWLGCRSLRLIGDTVWFIRDFTDEFKLVRRGRKLFVENVVTIIAHQAPSLLEDRYILYPADSPQARKELQISSNMMNDIVRENMGSAATDPRRDLSSYMSVNPNNPGAQVAIVTSFHAWKNVLFTLQEIYQKTIKAPGNRAFFDIVYNPDAAPGQPDLEFRTYRHVRGLDRTRLLSGWPNDVVLSVEFGTMLTSALREDHTAEKTYIFAAGQGEESERITKDAVDNSRADMSPYNWREQFVDARHIETPDGVQEKANDKLEEYRPRRLFTGKIRNVPGAQWPDDWQWGDRISVYHKRKSYNVYVEGVPFKVSQQNGLEVMATVRIEDPVD